MGEGTAVFAYDFGYTGVGTRIHPFIPYPYTRDLGFRDSGFGM